MPTASEEIVYVKLKEAVRLKTEMVSYLHADKHILEWHAKGILVDEKVIVPVGNITWVEVK